jgi:hypothetical protein
MSRKRKQRLDHQRKPALPSRRSPVGWIIGGLLTIGLIAALVLWPWSDGVTPESLVGRWLREDGGYVLEIRSASPDGRLVATYSNPRSIHVTRAEWRQQSGRLGVFVELRDVNYPGSTYTLVMTPEKDRLVGTYFQAVQRANFDVEFVRMKP